MKRRAVDVEFDNPATVYVRLTNGRDEVEIVADVELDRRCAVLRGLHILGAGPNAMGPERDGARTRWGPNAMGAGALRGLMRWAKEQLDVDELRIEGATRTSGARPGRVPRPINV
jgi:hypothetical protein